MAPPLNGLRNKVNGWVGGQQNRWNAEQFGFLQKYPSRPLFFQGLSTHSPPNVPQYAEDTPADQLEEHPTDQAEDWTDFDPNIPPGMPCSLIFDFYRGPGGRGWTTLAFFYYLYDEEVPQRWTLQERRWNQGPETWREFDWQETDIEVPPELVVVPSPNIQFSWGGPAGTQLGLSSVFEAMILSGWAVGLWSRMTDTLWHLTLAWLDGVQIVYSYDDHSPTAAPPDLSQSPESFVMVWINPLTPEERHQLWENGYEP